MKYYGNYRAKVVDNKDPEKYARVKVWIPDLMPEVSEDEGLWARPANNPIGGRNDEQKYAGSIYIPPKGSWLWVFFEAGNPNRPYYFGALELQNSKTLPENQVGSNYQNKWTIIKSLEGRTIIVSDDPDDARIEITGKKDKLSGDAPGDTDSVYDIDGNQNVILLDERDSKQKVLIRTKKGDFLHIDIDERKLQGYFANGINLKTDKFLYLQAAKINIKSDSDFNMSGGKINLKSDGDVNIESRSNINIKGSIDGIQLARQLLKSYPIAIVFITAHNDDETLEEILELAPYGFIAKPFSSKDIIITIQIAYKRYLTHMCSKNVKDIQNSKNVVINKKYHYSKNHDILYEDGNPVKLNQKQKLLIEILIDNLNHTVGYDILVDKIWEKDQIADSALRTLVYSLRKMLPELPLISYSKMGYMLQADKREEIE